MSRPIELRAWDKIDKVHFTVYDSETQTEFYIPHVCADRYILEQYTCHKDMKRTEEFPEGQKIFEGDKVKLCYGIPPTFDTFVIEYADDEVVADVSVSGWWMRNINKKRVSGSLCKTYENDIEVIGHIHEGE